MSGTGSIIPQEKMYNPYADSKDSLLTGVENEPNNVWELNQRWTSPDQAESAEQAYAISNIAGVTNQSILQNDELAGNQDDMGGSDWEQQVNKYTGVIGSTAGAAAGAAAGGSAGAAVGGSAGGSIGSVIGDIPGEVTSIGSKNANKRYMENPSLENMEKSAFWDYNSGNVDMDVLNALTGKGPSKYYRDEDQQKLLRKQVVVGAADRAATNFGGGIN